MRSARPPWRAARPLVAEPICRLGARLLLCALGLMGGLLASAASAQGPPEIARKRIEKMSAADRQELLRKLQRFDALSPDEQRKLRALHAQIASDPEARRLLLVMQRYHDWLTTLSPSQRDELRQLPPPQRLARVRQMRDEQLRRERLVRLPPEDLAELTAFLRDRARTRRFDPRWLGFLAHPGPPDAPGRPGGGPPPRGNRFEGAPPPEIMADLQGLRDRLSPETRDKLARATPDERRQMLRAWMDLAYRQLAPKMTDEQLDQFFAELPSKDREELLLNYAPDEMRKELRWMYLRDQWRDRPWRNGPPGRPGRPRPPQGPPPGGP